jgi:hypothetical protein
MPDTVRLPDFLAFVAPFLAELRLGLRWASQHTGLPVVVVAAIALVASWRLLKHSFRFALHVALATVILLAATVLGVIRW